MQGRQQFKKYHFRFLFKLNPLPMVSKLLCRKHSFYSKHGIRVVFACVFSYGIFRLFKTPGSLLPRGLFKLPLHLFWPDGDLCSNHYTPGPLELNFLLTSLLSHLFPFQSVQNTAAKTSFLVCQSSNCVYSLSLLYKIQIPYNRFSGSKMSTFTGVQANQGLHPIMLSPLLHCIVKLCSHWFPHHFTTLHFFSSELSEFSFIYFTSGSLLWPNKNGGSHTPSIIIRKIWPSWFFHAKIITSLVPDKALHHAICPKHQTCTAKKWTMKQM